MHPEETSISAFLQAAADSLLAKAGPSTARGRMQIFRMGSKSVVDTDRGHVRRASIRVALGDRGDIEGIAPTTPSPPNPSEAIDAAEAGNEGEVGALGCEREFNQPRGPPHPTPPRKSVATAFHKANITGDKVRMGFPRIRKPARNLSAVLFTL